MKRITGKCALLLTMMFSLFLSQGLIAQPCGTPPAAATGSISCYGQTTSATITLNLLGGPYNIQAAIDYFFPGAPLAAYATNYSGSTYTINNLYAGNHKVYVVDAGNGNCYDSVMFTITQPGILNFVNQFGSPATCAGVATGWFQMAGGSPPYTISYTQDDGLTWTNIATTSSSPYTTTLPLGAYGYQLTDANGCTVNNFNPAMGHTAFGYAATDQASSSIGICGVTDSSIEYLTGGNQTIARSISLLMQGIGQFSDSLRLDVSWGDATTNGGIYRTVGNNSPVSLTHTYFQGYGIYEITYIAINLTNPDTVIVTEFINNNSHVYPGDANSDGIANNYDLLDIGLGFGATGIARPGANLSWTAQPCPDWTQSFPSALNYKHLDCDGNAVVDYPDTTAILLNYGQTHTFRVMEQLMGNPGAPDLAVDVPAGSYPTGTSVIVPVTFGDASVPATDVYGIAFTVNYPVTAFDANNVNVSFGNSWMGDVGIDALAIRKNAPASGSIDIAFSRNDQMNITGYGTLCELGFITIDNVSGKMSQTTEHVTITNVRLIDKDGAEIAVNTVSDSVVVNGPTGVSEITSNSAIRMYPNPAKDHVTIAAKEIIEEIQLITIFGQRVIISLPNTSQARISTENLSSGVYIVKIKTANGTDTRRIEIVK